jgi:hypothetical protein
VPPQLQYLRRCAQLGLSLNFVEKMGYDLHITRREYWAETETAGITLEEWIAYVNNDKELELTNGYDRKIGIEIEFISLSGYCLWNAHPDKTDPSEWPWLSYEEGTIDAKYPDHPTIRKMIKIAAALNAIVQGDDGECYTEEYVTALEDAAEQSISFNTMSKKTWWKFW